MKTLMRVVSLLVLTAVAGGTSTDRFDGGGPQCSPKACPSLPQIAIAK